MKDYDKSHNVPIKNEEQNMAKLDKSVSSQNILDKWLTCFTTTVSGRVENRDRPRCLEFQKVLITMY